MSKVPGVRDIARLCENRRMESSESRISNVALERKCKQLSDLLKIERQKSRRLESQLEAQKPEKQPARPPEEPCPEPESANDENQEKLDEARKLQVALRKKLEKIKALSKVDKEQICALRNQLTLYEEKMSRKTQAAEMLRRHLEELSAQIEKDPRDSLEALQRLQREKEVVETNYKRATEEMDSMKVQYGAEKEALERAEHRTRSENEDLRESLKGKTSQLKSTMEECAMLKKKLAELQAKLDATVNMLETEQQLRAAAMEGRGYCAKNGSGLENESALG